MYMDSNSKYSIQILRSSKDYILEDSADTLVDGQPFYAKNENQLYVGNGQNIISVMNPINLNRHMVTMWLYYTDVKLSSSVSEYNPQWIKIVGEYLSTDMRSYRVTCSRSTYIDANGVEKLDTSYIQCVDRFNYMMGKGFSVISAWILGSQGQSNFKEYLPITPAFISEISGENSYLITPNDPDNTTGTFYMQKNSGQIFVRSDVWDIVGLGFNFDVCGRLILVSEGENLEFAKTGYIMAIEDAPTKG